MLKKHINRDSKTRALASLMFFLLIFSAFGSLHNETLEYKWSEGLTYNYRTRLTYGENVIRESIVRHVCLSLTDTAQDRHACLAVHTSLVLATDMPKSQLETIKCAEKIISFIEVDEHGHIKWEGISSTHAKVSLDLVSLIARRKLGLEVWLTIPNISLNVSDEWIDTAQRFRFHIRAFGNEKDDRPVAQIKGQRLAPYKDYHESTSSQETLTIDFDFIRGQILKMVYDVGNGMVFTVVLEEVARVSEKDMATLREARSKAIKKDDFIQESCLPRWQEKEIDMKTRRDVYRLLSQIDDHKLQQSIIKDALNQKMGHVTFYALGDLSNALKQKQNWALSLFIEAIDAENEDVALVAHDELCAISGLKLQKNQEIWRQWLDRQKKALPNLLDTNLEDLKAKVNYDDPWVRLFVLKQLSEREDINLESILEKAASDNDKEVRAFVNATLRNLKEKSKKENTPAQHP